MKERLRVKAPAKINLYLKIKGKRADGYHELITLMQKVDLADTIELEAIPAGIELRCPDCDLPENDGNLMWKAAELFLRRVGEGLPATRKGVRLSLSKKIPIAAGLGGGSSDAAAVLTGLNDLFDSGSPKEELLEMGGRLGADVPFFIAGWPAAWAAGIGEKLSPAVSLKNYHVLLVNPGFSVSTKWAFENFTLTNENKYNNLVCSHSMQDAFEANNDTRRALRLKEMHNDLEQVTARHHEEIDTLKKILLGSGAEAAMMSGSGPTVFGLFPDTDKDAAQQCCDLLKQRYGAVFLIPVISEETRLNQP